MTQRLFRPKTAAQQIGVSISQFWILVQRGEIKTFRNGGMTMIHSDEIDNYITKITPKAPSKRRAA